MPTLVLEVADPKTADPTPTLLLLADPAKTVLPMPTLVFVVAPANTADPIPTLFPPSVLFVNTEFPMATVFDIKKAEFARFVPKPTL
jgi:hypothetical protein